jgi:hypothetical protein
VIEPNSGNGLNYIEYFRIAPKWVEFTDTSWLLVVFRHCVPVEISHLLALPLQKIQDEEK